MKQTPYKTPLRYPGGKSRALAQILAQFPAQFSEFREPFVGGGSAFLMVRQRFPNTPVWINDLNFDLYCFWKEAQQNAKRLAEETLAIYENADSGKEIWLRLRDLPETMSDFDRAARFFVMNRITFSGTSDAGGYSEQAYRGRFTLSSIERLLPLQNLLEGVRITHGDYAELTEAPGEQVFLFLDPPYENATKSRLYGKRGALHTGFDHARFAQRIERCQHQWLITYDDTPEIRARFPFALQRSWTLQYGMNNYCRSHAERGAELFLSNYAPKEPSLSLSLFLE